MAVFRTGWIKLYRSLLDDPLFYAPDMLQLYIYCLLRAQYQETVDIVGNQKVELYPGQFISRRSTDSSNLGISESSYYRRLHQLEDWGYISLERTTKYTLVTIERWAVHQGDERIMNNNWTTTETTTEQELNSKQQFLLKENKELKEDKEREEALCTEECITLNNQVYSILTSTIGEEMTEHFAQYLTQLTKNSSL